MDVLDNEKLELFSKLEQELGFTFLNKDLLRHAFTHSSYANDQNLDTFSNNERLEFLGDAVLELTVSEFLYQEFPDMAEGEMTKLRASIVREPSLVKFARAHQFNVYLLLGRGEETSGGRERPSILADVFEAFIGALYLDQGISAVRKFLEQVVFPMITAGAFSSANDYKSHLQEIVQRKNAGTLVYEICGMEGPPHDRVFNTAVLVNGVVCGKGTGRTKKDSEQVAAAEALKKLSETPPRGR